MKSINYLEIIKQALSITWRNKFLWIFGFFIFLGSITSNTNLYNGRFGDQAKKMPPVTDFFQAHPSIFIAISAFSILILIALFLLRIIATVAITKSADNITLYRQLSTKAIFLESKKSILKLLSLEIIISLALGLIIVALAMPISYLFLLNSKIFAFLLLAVAIMIFMPLLLLAFYLRKYSYFYIILGDFKLKASLESAYAVITKNIKESLFMGVANIALEFLFFMAIIATCIAMAIIFAPLVLIPYLLLSEIGASIVLIVGIITLMVACIILFSWYSAFLQTTWLLFFQQISFEKSKEKKIMEKEKAEGGVPNPEVV